MKVLAGIDGSWQVFMILSCEVLIIFYQIMTNANLVMV